MQSALRIRGFLILGCNQPKFHPCLVESMYSKPSDTGAHCSHRTRPSLCVRSWNIPRFWYPWGLLEPSHFGY